MGQDALRGLMLLVVVGLMGHVSPRSEPWGRCEESVLGADIGSQKGPRSWMQASTVGMTTMGNAFASLLHAPVLGSTPETW